MCREAGNFCGAGGDAGGLAMVIAGAMIGAGYCFLLTTLKESEKEGKALALVYIAGLLMGTFGSVCIETDGAHRCGVGKYPGGITMVVLGAVSLFVVGILAVVSFTVGSNHHRILQFNVRNINTRVVQVPSEKMPLLWTAIMSPILAGLSSGPILLLVFGSICRHTGDYCGFVQIDKFHIHTMPYIHAFTLWSFYT